jgi:hypothetical protein
MWGRLRTLALAAVVAAAAFVPLFGDPRQTPITHPLWARMLLRSLDMTDAVRASSQASQVFAALAPRDSLSYSADRFLSATGAQLTGEGADSVLVAGASPAEVSFAVPVSQPGDYHLRARVSGSAGSPATAELRLIAGGDPLGSFTLVPAAETAWVSAGTAHLDPGGYSAQFLLPPGATLSQIEVAPPCVNAIEPASGWQATGVTTSDDLAITALKAIDREHELPPAATPIELTGEAFQVEAPYAAVEARATAAGLDAMTLRATRAGLRAIVSFEVPESGLYSMTAFLTPGDGQRFLVDGCRKAVVCPAETSGWRPVMAQTLAAGRHTLLLSMADGASFERLKLERKKTSAADYNATLRRLGFDPGPEGAITRARALDAMRFVRDQRRALMASLCGDRVQVDDSLAGQTTVAGSGTTEGPDLPPGGPGGPSGPIGPIGPIGPGGPGGPGQPPVQPPLIPPQPPSSPTTPSSPPPPSGN